MEAENEGDERVRLLTELEDLLAPYDRELIENDFPSLEAARFMRNSRLFAIKIRESLNMDEVWTDFEDTIRAGRIRLRSGGTSKVISLVLQELAEEKTPGYDKVGKGYLTMTDCELTKSTKDETVLYRLMNKYRKIIKPIKYSKVFNQTLTTGEIR